MLYPFLQEDKYFEESKDPIIKEIWERKEIPETGYGNCYETVKKIYETSQHVRVDWRSALGCSANIKYAKPDGTQLVLIDQDPGLMHRHKNSVGYLLNHLLVILVFNANWNTFAFHRFTPWYGRVNLLISRMIDAGLFKFWEDR